MQRLLNIKRTTIQRKKIKLYLHKCANFQFVVPLNIQKRKMLTSNIRGEHFLRTRIYLTNDIGPLAGLFFT